jgi:hypothetical protein
MSIVLNGSTGITAAAWSGTGSDAGQLGGVIQSFATERGGIGAVGFTMAYGNGQSAGKGIICLFRVN